MFIVSPYIVTKGGRKGMPEFIVGLCEEVGVKHTFCNIEYEVDELRREAKLSRMCLKKGISFTQVHDDVIVPPGDLKTRTAKQYEYTNVEWEYNNERFVAWCEGRTGLPIVDAAMLQMNQIVYMHNRCRMIVASFLICCSTGGRERGTVMEKERSPRRMDAYKRLSSTSSLETEP